MSRSLLSERRPAPLAFVVLAAYLATLLAVDQHVGLPGQLALGGLTWIVLLVALRPLSGLRRAQVVLVVCVATVGEVTGSIVWGVYTYRLENLPLFVPPAHGLVYLAGLSLAHAVGLRRDVLARVAVVAVTVWALVGLLGFPRLDVGGAAGALLLGYYLLRGRAPSVYAGVFLVVGALEVYGTALGTWTWSDTIPGTGIPNGNPPSGVASGYVWFDVVALALAPRLLALVRRLRKVVPAPRRESEHAVA